MCGRGWRADQGEKNELFCTPPRGKPASQEKRKEIEADPPLGPGKEGRLGESHSTSSLGPSSRHPCLPEAPWSHNLPFYRPHTCFALYSGPVRHRRSFGDLSSNCSDSPMSYRLATLGDPILASHLVRIHVVHVLLLNFVIFFTQFLQLGISSPALSTPSILAGGKPNATSPMKSA